ncbi:NUDIX hydrolase [Psychrobacillus psychrodurans]|uniref:NUDIX domain-containing protein n=1 Tax=Psychrobacillus psychrodurans TaxID=126157 RepID=A0A9X3LAB4_9BACI|nr:NUDIX domain-containing protein [Psychrobacillus psychrodurans]MCZ8534072.1 NUDIX domain-containing protein [Psychrobacillus psychrodurans]
MDISFNTTEGRFNYRVAGLIVKDNKLLIMQDKGQPYFYVPGGRIKMNEKSEDAVKREIQEELGVEVNVNRMLWINENFFKEETSEEQFHEVCFFYLVELKENEDLKGNEFVVDEEGKIHTYYWKTLDEIKYINLYPLFLRERIVDLPLHINHIVET